MRLVMVSTFERLRDDDTLRLFDSDRDGHSHGGQLHGSGTYTAQGWLEVGEAITGSREGVRPKERYRTAEPQ